MAKKSANKDKAVRKLIRVPPKVTTRKGKQKKTKVAKSVGITPEPAPIRNCWLYQPSSITTYSMRTTCSNCLQPGYIYIRVGIPVGQVEQFPLCSICACDGLSISK